MSEPKRRCFVIGPIGPVGSDIRKHADMLLNAVIKEVLERDEFGYQVFRADEVADPGMINDRVIHDIINVELAVADLTFLNANVFYELGIRHSREKPVIHFAQQGTILPFDNVGHRVITEDITNWHGIINTRRQIAAATKAIQSPDYRVSNPITQANASFRMRESADPKDRIMTEMQERIARLEKIAFTRPESNIISNEWDLRLAELHERRFITQSELAMINAEMDNLIKNDKLDDEKLDDLKHLQAAAAVRLAEIEKMISEARNRTEMKLM